MSERTACAHREWGSPPVEWPAVGSNRFCSKTGCRGVAVATLTYNYADSAVVLGPMSQRAEPHAYDLCQRHCRAMTAPVGWELLRLVSPEDLQAPPVADPDDLLALADAVKETPGTEPTPKASPLDDVTPDTTAHRVDRSVQPVAEDDVVDPRPTAGDTRPTLRILRSVES